MHLNARLSPKERSVEDLARVGVSADDAAEEKHVALGREDEVVVPAPSHLEVDGSPLTLVQKALLDRHHARVDRVIDREFVLRRIVGDILVECPVVLWQAIEVVLAQGHVPIFVGIVEVLFTILCRSAVEARHNCTKFYSIVYFF